MTHTFKPPLFGESHFIGRAGVVIEMASGRFVQILMEIRFGDPDDAASFTLEQEAETVWDSERAVPLFLPGITRGEVLLRGRLISREEMREHPSWVTDRPEVEARKEIEQ